MKAKRGRYRKHLLKETSNSELERAGSLRLVGAIKGGPRDVAERHSQYLKAKLRRRTRRTG